MLRFLPLALLTLLFSCSSLPPEVPVPEESGKKSVGKTEDGHNVVVYPEGYLDNVLTRIDAEDTSAVLVFKDMEPEYIPSVGDIIASPPTENAPYGFLYKVQGVSTKDGSTAVAARMATLEEAVEETDFESETEFQFDEDGNLLKMLQKSNSPGLSLIREIPLENGKKISADVSYSMTFVFDIKISWFKVKSTKVSLKQSGKTAIKGGVKQKVGVEIEKKIGSIELPNITLWVPIPVVVTNELSFYFKLAGNSETTDLTADYTINGSGEYGFEYNGGRWAKIATSNSENTFDYEQSMSGDITLGVYTGLESKFYGIVGLGLGAGPALRLSVEGNPVGVYVFEKGFKNSEKNGAYLDLGLDISADMNITLGRLGIGLSYTFAETWINLKRLREASFLPSFDDPQVSIGSSGVAIKSGIKRDMLSYPVKAFGFCVEGTKGDCKNGKGERKSLAESLRAGEHREINVTFSDVGYENYSIMPYFENGSGGIYYDRAVSVIGGVVQGSGSNSGSSSSGSGQLLPCVQESVTIGNQVWQKCNLNIVPTGENGAATNSVCYDNDPANCEIYGRLYDWPTAMALPDSCKTHICVGDVKHRGICPNGWHIPSYNEWKILIAEVGGSSTAGTKLKSVSLWNSDRNVPLGTDDYGFSALPSGGGSIYSDGRFSFSKIGSSGALWSSIDISHGGFSDALVQYMSYDHKEVLDGEYGKSILASVRCLQDFPSGVGSSSSSGGSGNNIANYKTTEIGTQVWMAENLNYDVPGSKCYYNDPINCAKYGRLYDWATAMDLPASCNSNACSGQITSKHRGICPSGWHIPSNNDWEVLITKVGGASTAAKYLKSLDWNGQDKYGFAALPGNYCGSDGSFNGVSYYSFYQNNNGNWWSASEYSATNAYSRYMYGYNEIYSSYGQKSPFYSVRCVKD